MKRRRFGLGVVHLFGTAVLAAGCASSAAPEGGGGLDSGTSDAGTVDRMDAGRDSASVDAGPGSVGICDPCEAHADCQSGFYCVPLTVGGRACLPACVADLPECPRGFSCVIDVAAGIDEPVCAPTGGPCCVDEDGDEHGVGAGCAGSDCNDDDPAVSPVASEICNGADDDCDSTVDDPPTDCSLPTCEAAGDGSFVAVEGSECSDGACTTGTTTPCGLYTCAGEACATTCLDAAGVPDHTICTSDAYCDPSGVCQPRTPDGSPCAEDAQCTSGHCDNGYCCSGGTCCATVSDCPGASAPTCIDPTTCQGQRGDSTCDSFRCGVVGGVPDDSACTTGTLALDCGLYDPIYCTGAVDQTPPACPTSCTADAECVDGAHCNGGACAPDRPAGDTCTRSGQCAATLSCVSGVCCMSASCDDSNACTNDLCTGGTCSSSAYCAGTATSCGCTTCTNCTTLDGWVDTGSPYACCDGGQSCTCQNQEYRTHTCSGASCIFSVTSMRVVRSGCTTCSDGSSCTTDACSSGMCTYTPVCAGTTTSCGCTSCTSCAASDGWYDVGASYACCDGSADRCTCQNQEYRTHSCSGTSCIYSITASRVARSGCVTCSDGNPCTADACAAGACGAAAYCAGTAASCGCTSCVSCTGGMECSAGTCACPSGMTDCSGTCRDLATDTGSCGACGRICPPGATCSGGTCHYGTQACPTGQYATGFSTSGVIQCSTLNALAMDAVHARCRIYQGWRDSCGSCASAPSKWGYTSQNACTVGSGVDSTCGIHTLNLVDVRMFGLNPDGDVDDNDKLYYGLHCRDGLAGTTTRTGACPAGYFITSLNDDGSFVCTAVEAAIVGYVRNSCSLYTGWIDNCNGCTTASSRSGRVSHGSCTNIAGGTNNCSLYTLGGTTLWMFGLNTGGDVDGNDQLRMGFSCAAVGDAPTSATACPADQFSTGVSGTSVTCNPASARADDYVRTRCWSYQGSRDDCGSCTSSPAKWGRANTSLCQSGLGSDNSCATYSLAGASVPMFGLNLDGDVDGNDKLYVGLRCL